MFVRPIINTGIQIMGKGVTVILGLVITGVLTRRLGPQAFGWFTLIASTFILFDALADFGTKIIGVREISQNLKIKKQKFEEIFVLRVILMLGAVGLGLLVVWGWAGFEEIRWEATVALMMVILTSAAGSLEILFQVEMRMEKKVLMDVLFPVFFLVWLLLTRNRVELAVIFVGYLVARMISLGVGVKTVGRNYELSIIRWRKIGKLFKEAWPMGMYLVIFTAYDRTVDSLMIERLLGVREIAWYGLAYKVYLNLLQPAYFWISSIFPLLGENKARRRLFWGSLIMLLAGVLVIIGVISWLAPVIVAVAGGQDFGPTVGVLRILVWACLFSYIGHLMGFWLISKRGQGAMLKLGLATLTFNVLANWWIIPKWSIYGTAGVTVATEALGCGLMGWSLWRRVRKK